VSRGIPPPLDAVVLKALSRERGARFATARDMAVAIEASCPIASTREVGEWVEVLAKTTLQERARALAAVEAYDMQIETSGPHPAVSLLSSSVPYVVDPSESEATQAAIPASRRSESVPQPIPVEPVSTVTRMTASTAPRTTTTAPPASRRPVFLIVGAAALTLAIAAFASRGATTAPTAPSASAAPAPLPTPREPEPVASVAAVPSSSAAASASARPTKKGAPSRPDCADPFRAGPDGILHVRPECMK
jgi:serine/threonine-protein kinase